MRQLKISQPTDPAWEAERAQALPLLRSLTSAQPLGLETAPQEKLLQLIVSVAAQYRGQGAAWEELLRAGFAGAMQHIAHYAKQPDEADRFLAWSVREEMIKLLI